MAEPSSPLALAVLFIGLGIGAVDARLSFLSGEARAGLETLATAGVSVVRDFGTDGVLR